MPTSTRLCGRCGRDEPVVDTVEKGLKAAKAAGVPVDLEGGAAAGVGFGGDQDGLRARAVPAKKPVPPPKPVPKVSPLGKAAAKPREGPAGRKGRTGDAAASDRAGCGRGRCHRDVRPGAGRRACGPAAGPAGAAARCRDRQTTRPSPR